MQPAGSAGPRRLGPPGRSARKRRSRPHPVPPRRDRPPGPLARATARLVARVADWITTRLGAGTAAGRERISEAELRALVAANTVLDAHERKIIAEVLAAGARLVREVMVPRPDVTFLGAELSVASAAERARSEWHTRYPVVDGTPDDVVGVVSLRDLLGPPAGAVLVRHLVYEIKRLPDSKRVLAALAEMRREGQHIALVVDEYGGTAGIVTLEDLVEELVGEVGNGDAPPAGGGQLAGEVDGRLNLADFAERTGLALPTGPYETVGGFLMAALGRLPRPGDEVRVPARPVDGEEEDWVLRVLSLDGRRVARVGVLPPPAAVPQARAALDAAGLVDL